MKKILLAAALLAVASVNSFGAACSDGTLSSLIGSTCTVGSSDQWELSNFFLFGNTGAQNGYNSNIAETDLFVDFTNISTNGFSISYSLAPGANDDYFTANSPLDSIEWRNLVFVNGTVGSASSITSVTMSAEGFFGNANLTLFKRVRTQAGVIIPGTQEIMDICLLCGPPFDTGTGPYGNSFAVSDVQNWDAVGSTGSSGLTSYTNTFLADVPSGGVPEPMTFVLMGLGLVGVAALRRRKA